MLTDELVSECSRADAPRHWQVCRRCHGRRPATTTGLRDPHTSGTLARLRIARIGTSGHVHRVLPVIGGMLLAIADEGPDFGRYVDWAWALLHGDIFDLRGNVMSPGGVPFTIASVGTGLFFAVGKTVLFSMPFGAAAMVTGWLAAVTFWVSTLIVLRRLARGDDWLALFGAGVLFVGTHAGLYSHAYSTEVFANALIALLWAWALTRDRWRSLECAVVGALTGLLFLVRPHVVVYAIPALWLAVRGDAGGGAQALKRPLSMRHMVAIAIPLTVAAAQYAVVNQWMTGEPWHPPYLYEGPGFSSVDLANPEIAAVLVHPWHGLLSYHPLYGLAFVAVVCEAWRSRSQVWWFATAFAVGLHVWVQAGWHIWWLGGTTFGMRGMAPAALPLVAGLVATLRRDVDTNPRRATVWLWTALVACAWSYPLLIRGSSQFLTWRELLTAQRPALAACGVLLTGWAFWAYRYRSPSAAPAVSLARACTLVLLSATAIYLAWQFAMRPVATAVLEAMLGTVALVAGIRAVSIRGSDGNGSRRRATAASVMAMVLFTLQAGFFARLAIRTEQHLASGAAPPRQFDYVGASLVDDLRMTYAEYLTVPGFDERKAAFRRFLAWQRLQVSPMSSSDRQIAEALHRRLGEDALVGDTLVEVWVRDGVVNVIAPGISDGEESRVRELAMSVPGARSVTFLSN